MKQVLGACLAVAALASAASATTSDCLTYTDPAGDVDVVYTDVVAPSPEPQLTPAVDLLAAGLSASTAGVAAAFRPAELADPPPGVVYTYSARFEDATVMYQLAATRFGVGASTPLMGPYELRVSPKPSGDAPQLVESRDIPVTGSIDPATGEIRVAAPSSAFPAPLGSGASWTVTDVEVVVGPMGATGGGWDLVPAAPGDTLEVGAGC